MDELKETNVVPLRTIEEHVGLVHRKWKALDQAGDKYKSVRVGLALELRDLRQRIENGEAGDQAALDWWDWYDDNFQRSRGDAEKLLAIANAQDPQAAYEAANARDAANMRAYRRRQITIVDGEGKAEQNQCPANVSGTVKVTSEVAAVPKIAAMPRPRYTTGPDDDALVVQGMAIFERLSWDGRVRLMKEMSERYERWHREGT